MEIRTAAVAGAGIGGLATALALAREGFRVAVFERGRLRTNEGAGLQLGPNATRVLERLDVLDQIRSKSSAPHAVDILDATTGTLRAQLPLGDYAVTTFGAPYLTIARQDLHQTLLTACGEMPEIVFHEENAISRLAGPPQLRFESVDGVPIVADLLVGADGVRTEIGKSPIFGHRTVDRTAVRQTLALRAMIPRAGLPDVFSFSRIGLWIAGHVHVVHYPVAGAELLNVVVITHAIDRHVETTDDAWRVDVGLDDVRAALRDTVPALGELASAGGKTWSGWILHQDSAAPRMASGTCALVGDAAHPVLPYQAQGAAMALEDAEALALCIGDPDVPIEHGLKTYQDLRLARTQKVAATSRRNKTIYNLEGFFGAARNAAMTTIPGRVLLKQFQWLYGYDVMDHIEE